MRISSRILAFCLWVCVCAVAQEPVPPQAKDAPGRTPETKPAEDGKAADKTAAFAIDYSQESYVVEQLRNTYRFENDGTGTREVYARVRVQSDAGVQQWGQVVAGYNSASERLDVQYVRVHKKDGATVTAPADSVQDLSAPVEREAPVYTDFRQKHITVPGLRPGEVLEYDLIYVTHTPLAPGEFWILHDFDDHSILLDERLEVNIPRQRVVKLKTRTEYPAKISEENDRRIYRWSSSHLEREDEEDQAKKNKKAAHPKDSEQPDVQMSTFAGWEDVGRWYGGLERDRRIPSPEIRAKADELTKGLSTDLEKIEALYDYVAKNFRYVSLSLGLARYQPHLASDVLHNQYGDCKDKHTLLAALLEAKGYHASSVLIGSGRKLDPEIPSPSQFDHVISLVPLAGQDVWMDTTTEVAPFRLLSFNLRNKQALAIPAEGVPRLVETPADPPMPSSTVEEVEGKINELGKLEAHVHFTTRGDYELVMRILFRRLANTQWKKFVERMSAIAGLDGEVSDLKVNDPTATRVPFEFSYHIEKTNFFDFSSKKAPVRLPLSSFQVPEPDLDTESTEPLKLGVPGENVYRLKLEFPERYTARAPVPVAMKRDFGLYESKYKLEKNLFTAERRMVGREREIPRSAGEGYSAFRRVVLADLEQQLSLESTLSGTPSIPADSKADDLAETGYEALKNGNYPLAVELLKKAAEIDPKNKGVWNNLGLAYLDQRMTDEAIAAFKKQVEVNPYDEYAYNNLGRAYRLQRKYQEAADAFLKQLEINPLDKWAHANLGELYMDWKKWEEAVAELEKAVSISSDNAILYVDLGTAYLNTGKDQEALTAYDRALDMAANPLMWNNIAYQLSLKKSHLDKARQYAESAVSATTAALRNVNLNQLNVRDLGLVSSLAAYWDTLGWIYFAGNDLDKAEKYIHSAWQVGQHSEIADHLGQIYEQRGQKAEAIRAYALAISCYRPDPETRVRLVAIAGGEKQADAAIKARRDEVQKLRTIELGKIAKTTGGADFFVVLAPGSAGGVSVEGVKFISGDEKLKSMADLLRTAKYPQTFPDESPARILRRGSLYCSTTTGDCSFVLLLPDDVRSVQ